MPIKSIVLMKEFWIITSFFYIFFVMNNVLYSILGYISSFYIIISMQLTIS